LPLKNSEQGKTSYVLLEDMLRAAPLTVANSMTLPDFGIRIGESFGHDKTFWRPLLEYKDGDAFFRIDLAEMFTNTAHARDALKWIADYVHAHKKEVNLQPGSVMVINNRKAAHARVGFTPDFSTGDHRWLQRMYMTKDLTQGEKADDRYPHVWHGG